MDDPYPTSRDLALRFLRLAGRATLAAAVVLLFYATISLWLSRTPPDELIRLTVLNIPFSVAGSVVGTARERTRRL